MCCTLTQWIESEHYTPPPFSWMSWSIPKCPSPFCGILVHSFCSCLLFLLCSSSFPDHWFIPTPFLIWNKDIFWSGFWAEFKYDSVIHHSDHIFVLSLNMMVLCIILITFLSWVQICWLLSHLLISFYMLILLLTIFFLALLNMVGNLFCTLIHLFCCHNQYILSYILQYIDI